MILINKEELEDLIYQALRDSLPNAIVELFPNEPSRFIARGSNNVLVKYENTTYSLPEIRQQIATMQYKVTLIVKNLRGKQGLYDLADKAMNIVTQLNAYGHNFFITSELIVDYNEEQGLWYYEQIYSLKLPTNLGRF